MISDLGLRIHTDCMRASPRPEKRLVLALKAAHRLSRLDRRIYALLNIVALSLNIVLLAWLRLKQLFETIVLGSSSKPPV